MQKTKGMAATEYLVVLLMLAFTFFAPVSNGKTSVELLMDALKVVYAGWTYVMSSAVFS